MFKRKRIKIAASGLNVVADTSTDTVPAKVKPKAGVGLGAIANLAGGVGAAADNFNPSATASYEKYQPYKSKEVDKLLPVAKELPIIGGFVKGAAGISNAVRGDGTSGLRNFAGDSLGGANTVKSIISGRWEEAIPLWGGFAKAKRVRKEMAKDMMLQQQVISRNKNEQSNRYFQTQTFANGGEIDADMYGDDGDYAVVLGGKLHSEGGNDIVDGDGEKVFETEREELLFTEPQTEEIEALIAKFDESKDPRHMIDLGRIVRDVIVLSTKDNSGKYDLSR